ncbi:hypothetical protein P7C73_g1185, partial [Tremellales sp. Uapishka_1]
MPSSKGKEVDSSSAHNTFSAAEYDQGKTSSFHDLAMDHYFAAPKEGSLARQTICGTPEEEYQESKVRCLPVVSLPRDRRYILRWTMPTDRLSGTKISDYCETNSAIIKKALKDSRLSASWITQDKPEDEAVLWTQSYFDAARQHFKDTRTDRLISPSTVNHFHQAGADLNENGMRDYWWKEERLCKIEDSES